ncbi:MAG: hypothetical protein QM638_14505 [Nocardioides sp.]|uniref:hypothetical protein n=1 Tax=Nocardioides sp. TaxID=35761 RepID=UPI0039E668A7
MSRPSPTRPTLIRRAVLPLCAAVLACSGALAACGDGSPEDATATASSSGQASEPAYDPCDSLDVAAVSKTLGQRVTMNRGTKKVSRCALLPVAENGPTFGLNYTWFAGGLDAAWKTMNIKAGTVTKPAVAGADSARLVVQRIDKKKRHSYAITGFIQNGELIQDVNLLAPAPYDAAKLRRATLLIMAQLSAGASAVSASASASASASG